MTNRVEPGDYRVRQGADNPGTVAAVRDTGTAGFLQLLARAARQFHTYPATSPLCTDAVAACHAAFVNLQLDHALTLRVGPRELMVDDRPVGIGSVIEQELARPLHRARVASVDIDRAVSPRDWSQFCATVAAAARGPQGFVTFAELLLDAGVGAIVVQMTPRPEVLEVGAPHSAVQTLVTRERTRQASLGSEGAAQYLYPPGKGWVRVDPSLGYDAVSLLDLTVLVNDPAALAGMLTRLIDEDTTGAEGIGAALEQRYGDVVTLIEALDPRLGRVLLSKLARAVLDLDGSRRQALLRRSVLPGLLDGRVDAEAVLAEFPDVELADALALLLDMEVAAPEVLPLALERLRLPADRRAKLVPLIESKLGGRRSAGDRWSAAGFDERAAALTRVDSRVAHNYGEFAAYDLSITSRTADVLAGMRDSIIGGDASEAQLACAVHLAKIEPNPGVVSAVLARGLASVDTLIRDRRWQDVTRWFARLAELAAELRESRPDIARTVRDALAQRCGKGLAFELAQMCGAEPGRTYCVGIVSALGPAIAHAWIDALLVPADRVRVRPLTAVMCECARHIAPGIVDRLATLEGDTARTAICVLGFAGAGYEARIAETLAANDEARTREALRALARIATPKAASLIVAQLEHGPVNLQAAAEEALWRLPVAVANARTRELLGRRDFVTRHPRAAARLLERAAQCADDRFDPVLESLSPLRFHFWSPAVARVGAKARNLLQ
jgi:hypothetical protein